MQNALKTTLTLLAAIAGTSLMAAPHAHAQATIGCGDVFNEWDKPASLNGVGPTGLELIFAGDARALIPAQVTNDAVVNPFYANYLYSGAAVHNTTVHYNATTNQTTVRLSGGALPVVPPLGVDSYLGQNAPWKGYTQSGASYHVGLNRGFVPGNPIIQKRWTFGGKKAPPHDIWIGDTGWDGQIDGTNIDAAQAAVIYVQTAGSEPNGTWTSSCYAPSPDGTAPTFHIANNGRSQLTLGSVGVETGIALPNDNKCRTSAKCSGNQKRLDALGDISYPEPGAPGSRFKTVDSLNGVTLAPGEAVDFSAP